jgi:hypothetical protein
VGHFRIAATLSRAGRRRDEWYRSVGGPQRATAIRLFKAHVLGRARSRHSPRGQALLPCPRDRGLKVRDEIYEDIVSKGWNEKRQAFLQHYGSASLDAANLMMALTFFLAPTDPRMLATLDATLLPLEKGGLTANGLVYRYNIKEAGDGLSGEEGTQYLHVWLVEALTRAGRHDRSRLEEARLIFERRSALPTMLPLRGRHRASRRRPGKLPASFHAPRPGPRRVQLGPRAGARPIMRPGWSNDVVVRAMPYHG